jgi:hypothetical protein
MDEARVKNTELAEITGVTIQAIGGWMKTGSIDRKHWPAICDRLGITLDWLLLGVNPKHPFGVNEPGATYNDPGLRQALDEFAHATPDERQTALVILRQLRATKDPKAGNDHNTEKKRSFGSGG